MEILIIVGIMILVLGGFGAGAFICDVFIAKFPKVEKIIDKVIEKL